MKLNIFIFIFLGLLLINFTSATDLGVFKQNECILLYQLCDICTYVNITSVKLPNSTIININEQMDRNGVDYTYSFCNTSLLGEYQYSVCGDKGTFICEEIRFEVTPSGKELEISKSISYLSFILFLFILMGVFYVLHKTVDFKKWNNKIISRYENKNYIKLVFSSIGYNLMKNAFVIYYLIGLAVLVIITDFVYMANIVSITEIMPSVLAIYSVGIIIVGIYFFGYVQEWFINLLNQIKDMDWGMR